MKNKLLIPVFIAGLVFGTAATIGVKKVVDAKNENGEILNKFDHLVLAEDLNTETSDIWAHTLTLSDNIWLTYYVETTKFSGDLKSHGIHIWTDEDSVGKDTPDFALEPSGTAIFNEKTYEIYNLKGLSYKCLVDAMYAHVFYENAAGEISYDSGYDNYAMIDYCFHKKADETKIENGDYTLGQFVAKIVAYATDCQKYFGYKNEADTLAENVFVYGRRIGYYFAKSIYASSPNYFKTKDELIASLREGIYGTNEVINVNEVIAEEILNIYSLSDNLKINFKEGSVCSSLHLSGDSIGINDLKIGKIYCTCSKSVSFDNCLVTGDILNFRTEDNTNADLTFSNCTFSPVDSVKMNFYNYWLDITFNNVCFKNCGYMFYLYLTDCTTLILNSSEFHSTYFQFVNEAYSQETLNSTIYVSNDTIMDSACRHSGCNIVYED